MADTLEYILSLRDEISSKLDKVGFSSDGMRNKISQLKESIDSSKKTMRDLGQESDQLGKRFSAMRNLGGSIGALQERLAALRNERDWIPANKIQNIKAYNKEIEHLDRKIQNLQATTGRSKIGGWFDDAFQQVPFAGLLKNPLVIAGAMAGKSIHLGIQSEMQNTAFSVILGGEEAAKGLIDDIANYSKKTPYEKLGLGDAAKTMLGFGIAQEKIMPNLKMIGDIAMGDANKMNSLALAFSQIQLAGKLQGQDLMQLINAGFNPLGVIAQQTGKSMSELKDEMAKGAISAQMVEDAFRAATEEGGQFYGMADKMSETVGGKLSTMMDNLNDLFLKLFNIIQPVLMPAIDLLIFGFTAIGDGIEWFMQAIEEGNPWLIALGSLIAGVTAGLIAFKIANNIGKISIVQIIAGMKAKIVTWWALNAAMLANPVFLITAGIVALGAAVYGFTKLLNSQTQAQQLSNEVSKRSTAAAADENAELNISIEQLKKTNAGSKERIKLMDELAGKYPEIISKYDLENASLEQINKMHKEIADSVMERARKEVLADMYKEQMRERLEKEAAGPSFWQKASEFGVRSIAAVTTLGLSEYTGAYEKFGVTAERLHQKELGRISEKKDALLKMLTATEEKSKGMFSNIFTMMKGDFEDSMTGAADKIKALDPLNTEEGIRARIKELTDLKAGLQIGSKDYNAAESEINKLQKRLQRGKAGASGSKTNASIATGGTRNTVVNLSFNNMVENLNIAKAGFKESANEMEREITDNLMRTLAMANSAGG